MTSRSLLQAFRELDEEGSVDGRAARYRENYRVLTEGMHQLGFDDYVLVELQGYIITCFEHTATGA